MYEYALGTCLILRHGLPLPLVGSDAGYGGSSLAIYFCQERPKNPPLGGSSICTRPWMGMCSIASRARPPSGERSSRAGAGSRTLALESGGAQVLLCSDVCQTHSAPCSATPVGC